MLRPITPFCTNFFLISSFLPRILGSISSPFRVEFHYPLTPPSYSLAIHHLTPSVAAERKSNRRLEISELKNIRGGTPGLPSHDDLEILPGKCPSSGKSIWLGSKNRSVGTEWALHWYHLLRDAISFKTSDFIADSLMGWENTATHQGAAIEHIQIKVDNGPESSGVRTQFLKRIVEFVDHTRKSSNCCTIRLTTASTIRLSAAGAFWSSTGMEPSWCLSKRCWNGQKAWPGRGYSQW